MSPYHTSLSVNLNKVALLRNARHLAIPSVRKAALICLQAGAGGITVHPRPDQRHIRFSDVGDLAQLLADWRANGHDVEFNIEGNPHHNLMDFVREFKPHQATFVPDSENQFTSDHGWRFPEDAASLRPLIAEAHKLGVRVSLFMDPDPEQMQCAKEVGADRVELYTETFARAYGSIEQNHISAAFTKACQAAVAAGLEVNAGHDLNLQNLSDFLLACPQVKEVSIGHAFIADALEMGYAQSVHAYKQRIALAHNGA